MNFAFQKDLQNYLSQQLGAEIPEITAELCPEGFDGDVTVSCFPLAKALRKNPMQIAQQAGEFLSKQDLKERVKKLVDENGNSYSIGDSALKMLADLHVLDGLGETNQMSLFDFNW